MEVISQFSMSGPDKYLSLFVSSFLEPHIHISGRDKQDFWAEISWQDKRDWRTSLSVRFTWSCSCIRCRGPAGSRWRSGRTCRCRRTCESVGGRRPAACCTSSRGPGHSLYGTAASFSCTKTDPMKTAKSHLQISLSEMTVRFLSAYRSSDSPF